MQHNQIEFVTVSPGSFLMGSTSTEIEECVEFWKSKLIKPEFTEEIFRAWIMKEFPPVEVSLDLFQISKYSITNGIYQIFCDKTGYRLPLSIRQGLSSDHPVWGVTVEDIKMFIHFLSLATSLTFRLPTEAEWEYTARGSNRLQYPYGNHFNPKYANTVESCIGTTTPVYQYEDFSSPFGAVDMAGNCEEWVIDCYHPYPGGTLIHDHLIEKLGPNYRILRGGSFASGGDLSRSARRHGPFPSSAYQYTGFRIVLPSISFKEVSTSALLLTL